MSIQNWAKWYERLAIVNAAGSPLFTKWMKVQYNLVLILPRQRQTHQISFETPVPGFANYLDMLVRCLNSEFSFSLTSFLTKAQEPSVHDYSFIVEYREEMDSYFSQCS